MIAWTPFPAAPNNHFIVHSGPYANFADAYAVQLSLDRNKCSDPTTWLGWRTFGQDFVVTEPGYYVFSDWTTTDDCQRFESPGHCCCVYGVPVSCWYDPPAAVCPSGGSAESGEAGWGSAFTGSGGGAESGAANFAQGSAWTASGGEEQSGAADYAQGSAWTASGGEKQSGAANITIGYVLAGAGGEKQSGAANITIGYVIAGAGGEKQSGAAEVHAATDLKVYGTNTNIDTSCDVTGETNQDLISTTGSGTATEGTSSTSFVERLVYDAIFAGTAGAFSASLNVTTNSFANGRFRVQVLDSTCTILESSSYCTTWTTTGVKTLSGTLTWPAGGVRIRISVELKHVPPGGTIVTITHGSNTWVTARTPI